MKTTSYLPEVSISFKILLNNLQSSKAALHPVPYDGNCNANNISKKNKRCKKKSVLLVKQLQRKQYKQAF